MKLTREEKQLITAPVSRKDAVHRLLRGAIVDGRLEAGARLDQDEIAAGLGVSRMPVREALKQLELEGLVAVFPYRGVRVASLDPVDIAELFAIRVALERLAVGRAVANLKASQISRMRKILVSMDAYAKTGTQDDPWLRINREFHDIINGACGWPRLVEMIDDLRDNVERYIRCYLALGGREQSQREHWELYEACVKRNASTAQKVIERHLNNTSRALIAAIEAQTQSDAS